VYPESVEVDSKRPVSPIVIHLGRLGDTILLNPLLRSLHSRYHSPCRLIGARCCLDIYRNHRDVGEIWHLSRHAPFLLSVRGWRVLWALRRAASAPVYICENEPRRLSRIKHLLALGGVDSRRCIFFADHRGTPEMHWIDRWQALSGLTPIALQDSHGTAPAPASGAAPRLEVFDSDRAERDAWLHAQGWAERTIILVQPGNRRSMRPRLLRPGPADSKEWPAARWAALLQQVHAHMPEALILLCGTPPERAMLRSIQAATGEPTVAVATPGLRPLFALCQVAHSMISVDSGPAHAAAAVGLPVLVLFGKHWQRQWLPRSHSGSAVIGVGGPPTSRHLEEISVETVFAAWRALLEQISASSALRGSISGGLDNRPQPTTSYVKS
jgi:ADP-heptose:LPS heptosyltransferase